MTTAQPKGSLDGTTVDTIILTGVDGIIFTGEHAKTTR